VAILAFEGFPLIVGWELTLACNLRCSHCGSSAGLPREKELTLKESLDICDQFPDLLVQEVDFTGGEPLLRDGWDLIAGRLNELGITTQIITNGLALDPGMISKIEEVGIRGVAISLDGLEATHDKIRGCKGLHEQVLRSIQLLHDEGIAVTAITTANALNINELPSVLDLVISSGADCWQIQPIFPLGRVKASNELRLSEQEYVRLGKFIKEIGPKAEKSGLRISPADSCGYFTGLDERKAQLEGL
jgi:MoaA/NifB/PqqE/SkfB family radical SAM enzyme